MNHTEIEDEYVHSIYSRLAAYQKKEKRSTSPRIWPRVRQFVESLPQGSIVVDVGCGEAKYTPPTTFVVGVDTCAEVLMGVRQRPNLDVMLGDAVNLPYRDNCLDAILNVSVIHHMASVQRRKAALQECARCLRVGGQMLLYAWAFEQPNGSFHGQDLLVPWNLHETAINGRLPKVKFHMNSTKEQRIIEVESAAKNIRQVTHIMQASIPIMIPNHDSLTSSAAKWLSSILNKVNSLKESIPYLSTTSSEAAQMRRKSALPLNALPAASPQFLPTTTSLISGIKRWSPMLGRRLAALLVPVEEQFADELANSILSESVVEAMATLREVTFYRFYHVFRNGELDELVAATPSLRLLSSTLEHGNWCVVAEKVPENYFRI